ncbi:MAG TPA: phage portal protein [Tepidisphaeraceae bacterium]|nr:phage portal protein [Tepidisphaeraceae bacterium]
MERKTTTTATNNEPTATNNEPSLEELARRTEQLLTTARQRYQRLWAYYRNPMRVIGARDGGTSDRPYRQAQEWGLPPRITGHRSGCDVLASLPIDQITRKEVVIENDIAWRVETMIDYLFGKPLVIDSAAPDPARRRQISELLRLILAHNGGILFLQQLALLGSVYGFVDVLVKLVPGNAPRPMDSACSPRDFGEPPACDDAPDEQQEDDRSTPAPHLPEPHDAASAPRGMEEINASLPADDSSRTSAADSSPHAAQLARLAGTVRLEVVEPARALPFLSPADYRIVNAYAHCLETSSDESAAAPARPKRTWTDHFRRAMAHLASVRSATGASPDTSITIDLLTAATWRRYENGKVVAEGENSLGEIPLVHIQNTAVPFEYSGASDVEPLMPLQDELNTRLSDRAHRITMQSFRMYLGKGIEGFDQLPVSPGRMWMTDNDQADIVEFGGDASSPSEDAHLSDIREALDKTSGVSPIAAGAIKGRIGRLTSAAALRVTMQALLAKTDKKRTTYGAAIARMCELSLAWLDAAGVFHTTPDERRVEINWPSPLPENELEKLQEAEAKVRLGVPSEIVRRELGY